MQIRGLWLVCFFSTGTVCVFIWIALLKSSTKVELLCFFLLLWKCWPRFTSMKYCDSIVFLLGENYFYLLQQAYSITWSLQSLPKFLWSNSNSTLSQTPMKCCYTLYIDTKVWKIRNSKMNKWRQKALSCKTTQIHPDVQLRNMLFNRSDWCGDILCGWVLETGVLTLPPPFFFLFPPWF